VHKGALQSTRARTVGVKMSGLEARLSSLEAAEREANAAEKAVREAEERMMRLSKVSASPSRPMPEPAPLPAPTTATVYSAAAMDDKEKGDDDDDDEPKEKKEPNDPFADGFGPYLNHSLDELFNPWKSPMNWLLLCTPFAYYGHHYGGDDVTVFILSVLAIAPMAERVSYVTEQLAMHTSETIGGLLNATFGNVTELIVSLVALFGGMLRIVQVSLLGSILSNLLLVLGCAFLVGGLKYPEQKYSHKAQTLSFGLLLLAVLCIAMPTVLEITHDVEYPEHSSLDVSRSMSLMMIVTYYLYLVFQLCTHQHIFEEGNEDEEDDEERVLGVTGAIFWLAMITVGISFLSEWMVDAIRGAAHGLGVPDLFLGTIIIPIVGNAAEHAAAIIFAAKNKMELSLGIAVGSATQIALFVLPACVLIGWAYDLPLDLNLHPFELSVLAFSVLLVGVVIQQGQSHWLLGFILVCSYVVVAMGFFVHTDPLPTGEPLFVPIEAPAHDRN